MARVVCALAEARAISLCKGGAQDSRVKRPIFFCFTVFKTESKHCNFYTLDAQHRSEHGRW